MRMASSQFRASTLTNQQRKFPPYGKQLAERILVGNPPFIVRCLVYGPPNYPHQIPPDPWLRAKLINQRSDSSALVLPHGEHPGRFTWPVRGLICVVEHWPSRNMDDIVATLSNHLLESGAEHVVVIDARFNCVRRAY